jgi:type I restriction enzyme, S subunit
VPSHQKASPLVRLGQLFKFTDGLTPSRDVAAYWDGEIPFATSQDLTDTKLDSTRDFVTRKAVRDGTPLVKPGSILMAVRGHAGGISITQEEVAIGGDLKAVEPISKRVSVRYVYWLLIYRQRESQVGGEQAGSYFIDLLSGRIRTADLQKLAFPLPRLPEQERVADILEDAYEAGKARASANNAFKKLLPALFTRMFESEGFSRLSLDQCARVIDGATISHATDEFWGGEIPWITSGDITSPFVSDSKKHITKQAVNKTGIELVPPGSIVIGSGPGLLSRNTSLLVALTEKECAIGQDLKALVCRRAVRPEYMTFALALAGPELLQQASGLLSKKLDVTALKSFIIPVPPLRQQKQWADTVADFRVMTRAGDESLTELESLFDVLASREFGRDTSRPKYVRGRPKERLKAIKAITTRALEADLSDRRPIIWPKLSDGQRRIWVLSQTIEKPFSVDELIAYCEKRRKSRVSREYALGTLELLVTLGVVIKEGRIDADRWRRPRPETDREVQI